MKLKLNVLLKEFIDKERKLLCRAVYIIRCVSYIRDNNIDINNYYEGDYVGTFEQTNKKAEGDDKQSV